MVSIASAVAALYRLISGLRNLASAADPLLLSKRHLMEAVLLHESLDRPLSPYKSHIRKNPRKIHQPFISRPYDNFLPSNIHSMGLLQAPPLFLSHSYPPYSLQSPPQPPLLPLPAAHPLRSSSSLGLSCPPANKNSNRARGHSLTSKKSKSPTKSPKKEEKKSPRRSSDAVTVSSTSPLGPDPKELPKNVAKVFPFDSTGNIRGNANTGINITGSLGSLNAVEDQVNMLPGSVVFTISPPPSSLPLPTFTLRPKLSCNTEAAGVDTGATDNLRRLLRLQ
ncbi:hypothetical protein Pfo_017077 [Paulownia fortunei]|nr:hypothetical protein Pfo_017077 [Paulownia fortunei]